LGKGAGVGRSDRYILSQLMMLFGFFSLVLVSVYWVNRAVRLFDQLIADGQSAWVFLEFTALSLPYVIWLVLPVSAFAATVYVTNRMTSESELVVLQATGFSPVRLARPALVFGLIITLLMTVLGHVLVPVSRAQLAIRSDEISGDLAARFLSPGNFINPAAGITVFIRDVTPAGELRDLFLSDSRAEGVQTIYTADRALLVKGDQGPKLVMFDGMAQMMRQPGKQLSTTRFADFAYDLGAALTRTSLRRPDPGELGSLELLTSPPVELAALNITRAQALNEIHNRLVQSLLAPIATLLGFVTLLTGTYSRFGIWRQIGLAVALLIFVKMVDNAAASAAQKGAPAALNYLGVGVGMALVVVLIWIAGRRRRVPDGPRAGAVA
jgi:lipopolysaccharide export system permease protein